MRTLALVTAKGGSGKSSLAVSLAVAAHQRGLRTYVVDLDPQGTARNWFARRKAEVPEVAAIESAQLAAGLLELSRQAYDLVIVDTPGADTPAAIAAMAAVDFVLIPARPSIADIEAARPTVQSLTRLGKPFGFVVTQAPAGRAMRTTDAYRALALAGVVSSVSVALRTDHLDALAQGLGVTELDPHGKAAAEIVELLDWILKRIEP